MRRSADCCISPAAAAHLSDVTHGLVTCRGREIERLLSGSRISRRATDVSHQHSQVSILSRRSVLSSFYRTSLVWRDELAGAARRRLVCRNGGLHFLEGTICHLDEVVNGQFMQNNQRSVKK